MAVPKRRKSKATRDHRRAQWMRSVPLPGQAAGNRCSDENCPTTYMPHRVCPVCGKYNGRQVMPPKVERTQA